MTIHHISNPEHSIVQLSGRFDAHQVQHFTSTVEPLSVATELDFAEVQFIDSSALAALIALYKHAQVKRIPLTISNVQDTVKLIFEVTKLDTILPIKTAT